MANGWASHQESLLRNSTFRLKNISTFQKILINLPVNVLSLPPYFATTAWTAAVSGGGGDERVLVGAFGVGGAVCLDVGHPRAWHLRVCVYLRPRPESTTGR